MNLIILDDSQWLSDQSPFNANLNERQQRHVTQILNAKQGDTLKVGKLNGNIGKARVLQAHSNSVVVRVNPLQLVQSPPPPSAAGLILTLPRPKVARRLIRTVTELGVKHIHLINSYRVEKSYWQSPLLAREKIDEQIILGLEQAGDTTPPAITLNQRFKPFVEDTLPEFIQGSLGLVAHPYASDEFSELLKGEAIDTSSCDNNPPDKPRVWLAIGPEGGFIPYEIEKLQQTGFTAFSAGKRIMRTETAVPYLLAQLHQAFATLDI